MGKDSKGKNGKKISKTNASKQVKGRIQKNKCKSVQKKPDERLLSSSSSLLRNSDFSKSCCSLLKDICAQAVSFQRHSLHNKLCVSDILKAREFYNLKTVPSVPGDNHEVKAEIDLENYLDVEVDVKEADKTFYCGKCLFSTEINGFEHYLTSKNLRDYFKFIMKAVFRNNSELFSLSLSDLKKNPNILPVLPVFIHNLCNEAIILNHQPAHLVKFLHIIHSLYLNPNLYFQSECIHKIVDFIISCALTNLYFIFDLFDDVISLQKTAAQIIHDIFIKYNFHLVHYIVSKIEIPFKVTKPKLISCCGALTIVNKLGLSVISPILPFIFLSLKGKDLLQQLSCVLDSYDMCTKNYMIILKRELLEVSKKLLRHSLFKILHLPEFTDIYKVPENEEALIDERESDVPLNIELCCAIIDYYGDTVNSCLPSILNESTQVVPVKGIFEMLLNKYKSEEKISL